MEERTVWGQPGTIRVRFGRKSFRGWFDIRRCSHARYYRGSGGECRGSVNFEHDPDVAGLILFQATLTLPGIAGIILTIGMAVDSMSDIRAHSGRIKNGQDYPFGDRAGICARVCDHY